MYVDFADSKEQEEQGNRGWRCDTDKKGTSGWTAAPRARDGTDTQAVPWDGSCELF